MKQLLLRPVLPILWIVVGVELSYLWGVIQPIDPGLIELLNKKGNLHEVSSAKEHEVKFSVSILSLSKDRESTGYSSSDGVGVSLTERSCGSRAMARQAYEQKINDAAQIIERGPRFNGSSKQLGERVVAIFPTEYQDIQKASVFWTNGSGFYSIESPSLPHALKFEKTFRERFPDW